VTHAPPVASHELLDASRDAIDNLAAPDDRTECSVVRLRRSWIPNSLEPYAAQWALSDFARDIYAVDLAVAVVATRPQRITSRS
jgi:hypothetical protein